MKPTTRFTLAILSLSIMVIIIGGVWFFQAQKQHLQQKAQDELTAISKLKVGEIVKWRQERLGDAKVLGDDPFLVQNLSRCLTQPDPSCERMLKTRFSALKRHHGYTSVVFYDPSGEPRFGHAGKPKPALDEAYREKIVKAELSQAMIGSLVRDPQDETIHLDFVAPLFKGADRTDLIGVVIQRVDPANYLFPLIQNWPTLSQTAETLLVRRDADHVLFLNDLRHRQTTALTLRVPMTQKNLPAVMAIEGQTGLVQGADYRGVEVLAVLAAIPDSDWFMVAKVDADEALATWRTQAMYILGVIFGLLLLSVVAMALVWQREGKVRYKAILAARQSQAESEFKFEAAFDQASIGRTLTLASGKLDRVNPTLCQMLGYSAEELQQMDFSQITHPDDLPASQECVRCLKAGEQSSYQFEKRYLHRSGKPVWTSVSTTLTRDRAGQPLYFITDILDISAHRQKDMELRSERDRSQKYLDIAGVMFVALDNQGLIELINQKGCEILGCSPAEAIGKNWFEHFIPARLRDQVGAEFARLMRSEVKALESFENPVLTKGGQERIIAWHNSLIDGVDGSIVGTLSSGIDITVRKQTEKALRESEERLQAIFASTPDYLVLLDLNHRIQLINRVEPGLSQAEVVGTELFLLVEADDRARIKVILDRVVENGQLQQYSTKFNRPDGSEILFSNVAAPVIIGGQAVGSVVSSRDVTERQKLELHSQHLQKMESIGQLAGGIAHDFNNMLTVINSYAGLIEDDLRDEDPLKADIQQISNAGKRAAALTRQLLAFSRKQVLQVEVLDLNEIVSDMEKMLKRLIGEDIEFQTRLADNMGRASADPGQLEQVLMNLAVNARDAMPHGGKMTIETANIELDEAYTRDRLGTEPGSYVMLAVSDNGAGMTDEVEARIFEPFFTTKELGQGTGLGLSTVYGIVKQSGGNISVYSETGQGTTFKIYLPRVEAEPTKQAQETPQTNTMGSETVLIVEDEKGVRDLAARILAKAGYQTIVAAGGGEVLLICEQRTDDIDLLITDVVMPKMSGKQLADRLEQVLPHLRVLFMSGYTDNAIVHHGVLDPDTHFIGKPFTAAELLRMVRQVLDEEHSA